MHAGARTFAILDMALRLAARGVLFLRNTPAATFLHDLPAAEANLP
jgi:hypothetical protein